MLSKVQSSPSESVPKFKIEKIKDLSNNPFVVRDEPAE